VTARSIIAAALLFASVASADVDDDALLGAAGKPAAKQRGYPAAFVDDMPRSNPDFVRQREIDRLAALIAVSREKSLFASALTCRLKASLAEARAEVSRAKRVAKDSGAGVVAPAELYELGETIVQNEEWIAFLKSSARKQRFALLPCAKAVAELASCWSGDACSAELSPAKNVQADWLMEAVESGEAELELRARLDADQIGSAELLAGVIVAGVKHP
jgi:hypothetical protein